MRWNKVIAISLVFFIMIGVLPDNVLANAQRPIQEIQKVTVAHQTTTTVTNEQSIVPKVQVDWIAPLDNDASTKDAEDDTKRPTYYDFTFTNMNDSSDSKSLEVEATKFNENAGVLSINAEEYFKSFFTNGKLYKTQITALHKHRIEKDGYYTYVNAPLSGEKIPEAYFITDFNLQADASEGLTFSWEYIPGVSYYLYYEKGNKKTISEMSGAGEAISAEKARAHLNEDGTRVVYTIDESVAGQIYSAYILPTGIDSSTVEFDEIYYNKTSPKLIHVTPNIPLEVVPLGNSKVRLSWDITKASWVTVGNKLYQTIIWQIGEDGKKVELGRIYNDNKGNQDVGYFECAAPTGTVTYQVDFILKDSSGNFDLGFSAGPKVYTPDELRQIPYQPIIPDLFKYKSTDTISNTDISLQDKYKVKFNGVFDDLILENNNVKEFREHTFHLDIVEGEAQVQLVWDAPQQLQDSTQVDYDLYYDIWVSEKANSFEDDDKVVSNLKIEENSSDQLIYMQDEKTVVGMKTTLEGLKTNRTYYIKMVAKRQYGENDFAISLPVIKQISIDKVGDVYEPAVIGKPPLQLKDVEKDSLTIAWTEQWYEVMASKDQVAKYSDEVEKLLAEWGHSRVYLTGENDVPIRYRDKEEKYGDPIDLYGSTVDSKIKKLASYFDGRYILNAVTMGSDTRYKIKVIKQTELTELIGDNYSDETDKLDKIQRWVLDIDQDEIENQWEDITDNLSDITLEGVSGKSAEIVADYTGSTLEANTPYVILISAYREIDGEWRYSTAPSYLLATTATDHVADLEIPKTPRLYNYESKDVRDTEITVRWIYNDSFEYELVYSRLDDPDKATVWTFTEDDKKTFVDGAEAYVTISGLLPETTYNFWIRAKQKAELVPEGEPKQSDWSTPVTSTTLTLANPLPPSGLGLASYQSIQEAGKDFKPKGSDYLTVEWMRNPSDLNNQDERITYSYIVEIADNPKFSDQTSVVVGDQDEEGTTSENNKTDDTNKTDDKDKTDEEVITSEILSKSMVKFSGLRAHAPYYIRVKTVLTFVDGDKTIVKESEFTSYIRLITDTSSDEYDGGDNPNIIEYPDPIVEEYKNGIWTYEIVDAAKITTQILASNNFYYTVTLENYKNKYDATTRSLKMPVKVLSTLANRGMSLQVVTNIATYEIPGEALKSYLEQYQGTDKVQFDFTRKSYSDIVTYVRSYPEEYKSGEAVKIGFRGNAKNTTVNTLNTAMKVKLKLDVATSYNYSNYTTYLYNYSTGNWEPQTYQVDTANNKYLTYATKYTGLNALYSRTIESSNIDSNYIMNALTSTYNITGLGTVYEQTDYVKASQYVKLMLGIAEDSKAINLTEGATSADYTAAKGASIYTSNAKGDVTREQALAGAVRLYEIKKGYKVKPSNRNFSNVSSTYREAASKAYAIGMIDSISDPQESITYGELCDWIALAID